MGDNNMATKTHYTRDDPSPCRRYLTLGWCFVECLLFGGTCFGWNSLVYIYRAEGIYEDLCTSNSGNSTITLNNVTAPSMALRDGDCDAQGERMALVFTLGVISQCSIAFPLGAIFDKYGLFVTRLIASVAAILGYLMLAFTNTDMPWLIFPGFISLAISCVTIILTSAHVAQLAGRFTPLLVALYAGAINTSGGVFWIIKICHDAGIPRQYSLPLLCGLWGIILINTFFLLPYNKVRQYDNTESKQCSTSSEGNTQDMNEVYVISNISNNSVVDVGENNQSNGVRKEGINGISKKEQGLAVYVFSPLYVTYVVWFASLHVCIQFFLGTYNYRLTKALDGNEDKISIFTDMLAYAQMTSLLIAPVVGALMVWRVRIVTEQGLTGQRRAIGAILSLCVTSIAALVMVSACLANTETFLYMATFFSEVLRSSLYATATAFLEITWPANIFGVLFGIAYMINGLGTIINYPYTIWAQTYSFFWVDLYLLGTCVVGCVHPLHIVIRHYLSKTKQEDRKTIVEDKARPHKMEQINTKS